MLTSELLDKLFDNQLDQPQYTSIEEMIVAAAEMIRPPERLTVSQAATKYRRLHNPGSYIGPWNNEKTPYLVEPMDTFQSTDYTGLIFAGPARTGKSDMLFNWLTYTAICDPADMIVYHMTEKIAREWSKGDLAKMLRHSPDVRATLLGGRQNDNVHDKYFKSGMKLLISFPSLTELSGKTMMRVWLQDYDRMEDDVEKEGPPFDLARKRTTSFKRFGMTVAESSPGREVENPKWMPKSVFSHEAPPTKGILSLYNRGDRRRWQWACPYCEEAFEPSFKNLNYPDIKSRDLWEVAEQVTLKCPHCQMDIEPRMKDMLNRSGRWVKEGFLWMPSKDIIDYHPSETIRPVKTDIASFWLKGPAAVFQDWSSLVFSFLQAEQAYADTGDEAPLKKTVNTDQGEAYISKAMLGSRLPEELKKRAQTWGSEKDNPTVPANVRFLVATVDVQEKSFVVHVHGIAPGGDIWLVDMFKIRKAKERKDDDGDADALNPGAYSEDWHTLIDKVLERTYPLDDGSGRHMMIKATGCDWGGAAGVAANALKFWRYLGAEHKGGHQKRFFLLKGEHSKTAPSTMQKYPDAGQKDSLTAARGDVPVIFINSTRVKDQAASYLDRKQGVGGGMIHFPHWTENFIYSQLTTEVRMAEKWENPNKKRNEAWDLLYYCIAMCHERSVQIMSDKPLFWERRVPDWAETWDKNVLVFDPAKREAPFGEKRKAKFDLKELGKELAGA